MNHNACINDIPHSRVGWGNSGDLTEYHVKNPSPGALPDVNTPTYRQESIGDLTLRLCYANSLCQFHLPLEGNSCQFPVNSSV